MSEVGGPCLYFGGPDRPPRFLRALLRERIDAVPGGGEIVWATYYFRDRDLATALIAASDRSVRVTLHVEGHPRRKGVNGEVIGMLRRHGLNGGLHVHSPSLKLLSPLHPHLHSKIYVFSHPAPTALVGSFNPSGDVPEDEAIIAEIGDQDRGHNMLVEYGDERIVRALRDHVLNLDRPAARFRLDQNRPVRADATTAWFYPRLNPGIIDRHLAALKPGSAISGAISHLKTGGLAQQMARAARNGTSVRLIVHDTMRRVPEQAIAMLGEAGVEIARYVHPEGLPLHAKFLLIDEPGKRTAYFGSLNYNPRSRWLNRELLMASSDEAIVDGLATRFAQIRAEAISLSASAMML